MNAGMPKLLATDGEGERLDRFELVTELASGGMATVYLARLSGVAGFQRLVAIKRLHPHLAKEPEFVEMFLDEARLAARIHHPNVVSIQEIGESEEGYYLVMDYVDGDTLAHLLARSAQTKKEIPWGVTIRILLDTLTGLHAAHELTDDLSRPLAIVHRDVSPQNILVGADGIARLTDFGVARAASRLSTTRSGQLKGKVAYMAPEQARGEPIDRRADIFSCGIVLWEALALKRLFRADGEAATLNRVLYDSIVPPSKHRSNVPQPLEAICMRALERDVDARFGTAADFADELERAGRELSCVASAREVAACLEAVVGPDLARQREAVRAWLARSEPSNSPVRSRPSMPDSVKTRVEGSKSGASVPPTSQGPPPNDAAGDRTRGETKVSSVSSAILQVPAHETAGAHEAPPRRPSTVRMALAVVVSGVVLGVGAWRATQLRTSTPPRTAAALPPEAHTPSALVQDPPPQPNPIATPSATVTASVSATSSVRPTPTPKTGPVRRPPIPGKTPAPVTATTIPDDLSKNPYR